MFQKWLKNNTLEDIDLSMPLFPPASDRSFWCDKSDPELIAQAEQYIGYGWPISYATDFMAFRTEGNRIQQEKPHFSRRHAFQTLLLGELCEYQGRFLPDIANGIFAICEETFWGISAHYPEGHDTDMLPDAEHCYIDLFAAETASLLATAYSLLRNELYAFCPQIITRLEYETDRRIIKPYLSHTDFWWMGYHQTVNNWNPWIISNLITVFLTIPMPSSTRLLGIQKMFREADNYCKDMPLDGGCDEGASYWSVAGGTLFEFCEQLFTASNGRIDLFSDERIQNSGKYICQAYIGDGYFANFADGTPKITHSLAGLLYLYGLRINDPRLKALAWELSQQTENLPPERRRDYKIKRSLYQMIYRQEILQKNPFHPEKSCAVDSIQNAFLHQGDWVCAAKGGHNNESHNHNDVGSFLAYWQNRPVLIDPSCGTYTAQTFGGGRYDIWTMQSDWHNLPQVNGHSQLPGKEYRADGFALSGNTASFSFAPAYPRESSLTTLSRQITLFPAGPQITDKFVFEKDENQIREHFVTTLPVRIEKEQVILGEQFILQVDTPCQICLDTVSFGDDEKLVNSWQTDHINRIGFCFDAGQNAVLTFRLKTL